MTEEARHFYTIWEMLHRGQANNVPCCETCRTYETCAASVKRCEAAGDSCANCARCYCYKPNQELVNISKVRGRE